MVLSKSLSVTYEIMYRNKMEKGLSWQCLIDKCIYIYLWRQDLVQQHKIILDRNGGGMGQPKETTFDCQWKSMVQIGELVKDEKFSLSYLFFFEINMQRVWYSPNVLPTMVCSQDFHRTWQTPFRRHPPIHHLGIPWAALWVEPCEHSPLSSTSTYAISSCQY